MLQLKHNDWTNLLYLRGVLAIYVLYHHIRNIHIPRISMLDEGAPAYEKISNVFVNFTGAFGLQAVLAFFVISGMSIYSGYKPERGLKMFYNRRFKRLYPALAFSVFSTYLFSQFYQVNYNWQNLVGTLTFCNGIIFGGAFAGNSPYWSLSCEAWYYLFFPFIFILMKSRIGTVSLISFALLIPLWKENGSMVLMHSISWVIGALIVKTCNYKDFGKKRMVWMFLASLILATAPYTILDFLDMNKGVQFMYVSLLSGLPCAGAVYAILCLFRDVSLDKKILKFLGDISYSLYLVHYPILKAVDHLINDGSFFSSYILSPIISILISIIVAFVCYRYIEKPLLPERKTSPSQT